MQKLHNSPYVMNSFLNQFPELVLTRGGDVKALCQAVGLSVEAITGPHQLIPFDKFIGLLEVAAEKLEYPDIALGLANRQGGATMGPMSILLSQCTHFAEALEKITTYLEIMISGFEVQVSQQSHLLELKFNVNLPALYHRQQFQNYLLAGTLVIIRSGLGAKYPLRGCYFTRQEPDLEQQKKHAEFFGCPVAFGADEIKITVDSGILNEPIEGLAESLDQQMGQLVFGEDDLAERLESMMALSIASGDVSLDSIAQALGYSTRTFRRRLASRGISFSATLDAVRLSQANKYLQSTHYKLSDISALLGYSNPSAFTRSYLRWCGMTPKQYRETLHTPP